ncbi:MAG: hypothetical protein HY040_12475 [Planctomycetes bacterium]|nr:hypothetical protein [Planctomycetota bacterium]
MQLRNFKPGDESGQAHVYNTAATRLPRFKPATVQEVQRRVRDREFDSGTRLYVEEDGKIVAYAAFNNNGRISHPWCLPGYERCAEPLWNAVIEAMRKRGHAKVFAAYRDDWPSVHEFFLRRGFKRIRDMVNFVVDLVEMPTPSARAVNTISPVTVDDLAAIFALAPEIVRAKTPQELEKHLFHNPYFSADSLYALRGRQDGQVVALGIAVYEPTYADPNAVDSAMPCFRLGAFGTEGMQAKRIRGLFSFLAKPGMTLAGFGMDLMGHAAFRLREYDDVGCLAAQAPSDVPSLLNFYERNFRRQGSFPVFEKTI